MKKVSTLTKFIPLLILILSFLVLGISFIPQGAKADEQTYEIKTITEIGKPTIAGTGSYVDDGVLYYASGGNTVGYNIEHSNILFDFDIILTSYSFPNWLSITLKASGLDRTQSSNLEQKGYSFAFFPAGQIYIWKNGETLATINHAFNINTKYNFKIGALNEDNNVRLILKVNNESVVNLIDSTNPYSTGTWFNICGEGAVSAEIYTTKKVVIPDYYTYTLSTMGEYPTRAGTELAEVDKNNNITINSSGSSVGFSQHLQNFSFEAKFNFTKFEWPANFYIGTRASGFDRVMSSNLSRKGYSFRIASTGAVQIYKEKSSLATGNTGFKIEAGKDYIFEVGTVDINKNSTYVFFAVNNKVVASAYDNENPIQAKGNINMNGDGKIACTITSSDTKLSPLQTQVEENENQKILSTYFVNPISYSAMNYEDFSERNLKAITIGDKTIDKINKTCYALSQSSQVKAVDVKFEDNVLVVIVNKNIYNKNTNATVSLDMSSFSILRTSSRQGLEAPSGYILKQTYSVSI